MVGRTGLGTPAAGVALSPVQAGDGTITVPDAHLLFTAEFSRVGDDLLLTGSDGTIQIVNDYFSLEGPPPLFSPDGAMMSPELVAMLVGPRAPSLQYAQAGGAPVSEAIGQVETLTGSAQVIRAGAAVDLAIGDSVFQGDIVQTGLGSALGITFIDETVFSLSGDSRMALSSMVYDPGGSANSMLFDLIQGTFVFITGKIAPTGDMRVETPVATIGVRGTTPISKISAIDGTTTFSLGEDPDGGLGTYTLFDKLTGGSLTTISSLTQLVRIQAAGGSFFESVKTPGQEALDRTLVLQARDTFSRSQQRLDEEDRGESGEFQQATEDPSAVPLETAAGPNNLTSGGLGVDEPEFGEEEVVETELSSSEDDEESNNNPTPSGFGTVGPGSNLVGGAPADPPVAGDDEVVSAEDTPVTIAVLGNDSDPNGDPLSIVAVTQGANGTVTINPNGTITYSPNENFNGDDTFAYTLSDGVGGSDTATVSVSVTPVNDVPLVTAGTGEINQSTIVLVTPALLSAVDVETTDPAQLVFTVTEITNGAIQVNGEPANSFTQAQINAGQVSFIFQLSDSGISNFTVTAADPDGGVSDPATVDFDLIPGNGLTDALVLGGDTIAPGASAGTRPVSGDFTLDSGTLEMELGGTGAGQSDLVEVAGQADVQGGLVDFTLIDGYIPAAGDTIEFLTADGGLTGSPENLSSAVHGVTQDFDYQLDFSSGAASFTALSAAQAGNSTIYHGGALDDVYAGGDGDDVLRGGAGADTLSGGAGHDLFVLAPGEGGSSLTAADVLTDFEDGADLIGLAGSLQFSDLSVGASGAGGSTITVVSTGEILAFVEGIAPGSLDTDDFTIVM